MSVTTNTIDFYKRLITSEHSDKPKFMAFYLGCVLPLVNLQSFLVGFLEDFYVDTAVGVQLDAVGLWVGVSRYLKVPLDNVWYTVGGTIEQGVGTGVLKGVFQAGDQFIALGDNAYRMLIYAKIAQNHWDGSIPGAYAVWESVFGPPAPGVPTLYIQDNQDMSMNFGVGNIVLNPIQYALLTGGYIDLRPEGVRIANYIITPIAAPIFVWGTSYWGQAAWGVWVNV
jgi:Protein of unknown function (DUF2612)